MITKKQIINFIKNHSSFENIIEACQNAPNSYSIRFLSTEAELKFNNDFSDWSYAKIKNETDFLIYAKVGIVHHKKFDRDLGFIFILENQDKIEHIYGYLIQNIKNKLSLIQMADE